ncbi:alpha-2-macroglobulin family protein [Zophobihabitans entericus]|uniref:Alpha-2-macroglobulin family protein n=1 Tax=Zophobihabitans entericus TaxID=1635327 RepID=A0A6G9IBB4_9GAMM|nr:alpha-2-macroglobulin [Zophobihabitans entericus]QIQ21513.1 alpha-2-macroglobulin family protein [Zophobihabitans entericus]
MGFLRFLLQLPYYIITIAIEAVIYFIIFILALLKAILWLFTPLIGSLQWKKPVWVSKFASGINYIGQSLKQKTGQYKTLIGSTIIVLAVAGISGNYLYHWYLNKPKPIDPAPIVVNTYSARYFAPTGNSSPLRIRFEGHYRSPAPLELMNNTFTEGVKLTPEIEGTWKWIRDTEISFSPKGSWPLGVQYKIELDDSLLFAPNHKLYDKSKVNTFTTRDFNYSISRSEFYQDPVKPEEKSVIFSVDFSHPVDKSTFEKNIALEMYEYVPDEPAKFIKPYEFTVTYNNENTQAWIRSTNIGLQEQQTFIQLSIHQGVGSTLGGNTSKATQQWGQSIPSLYSLNLSPISISLLEIDNQTMRQALILTFSHNVDVKDVAKIINVWQLPNTEPQKSYMVRYFDSLDSQYKNKLNVTSEDLANSKLLPLKPADSERQYQRQVSFEIKADQGSQLYVSLDKNLTSDGGYQLHDKYEEILRVPYYPRFLSFVSEGALLPLSGDQSLTFVSRNMSELKLDIERVLPEQLQHLVSFNRNQYQNMNFGYIGSEHFVEKFSLKQDIVGSPEEVIYTNVNLSKYLLDNDNKMRGVFLLKAYSKPLAQMQPVGDNDEEFEGEFEDEEPEELSYDPNNTGYTFQGSRFIVITDLGLINKTSLDGSHDIFVQSITSGQPVDKAKVSVVGENGVEITSALTDELGHVKFEPFQKLYNGIRPIMYLVEKEQDTSFLPVTSYDRDLNLSRFDVGGLSESLKGNELRAYLFSDRGIYRPGDTFNIGIMVKAQNWNIPLEGVYVEASIYDAKYNFVTSKRFPLDEFGFNEISYTTTESSPTGEWFVYLNIKTEVDYSEELESVLLGSTSVIIREFEPDKTTVTATFEPEVKIGWTSPDSLSAKIVAQNLFGTPAQDRVVESKLILEPAIPSFKQYASYSFYQSISSQRSSFNITLEAERTNDEGIAEIDLSSQLSSFEGTYTVRLLTDVFEADSGRSVAAVATTFVSNDEYLIGAKSDGNLNYIKRDAERSLDFIAIDSKLNQIQSENLTATVIEQRYLSVLVKQPSGVYKYESQRKDMTLSETPFVISDTRTIYPLDTSQPGNYILQLKDENGKVVYQTYYSIAGSANVTRSLDRNTELMLKIDRQEYQPGDEIEVSITSPYIGSGLITIERDQVYSWTWFTTTTTSSVQKITIPEGVEGNAYVNVQFIRGQNSDEIFMSPLSYGVIPFKVTNAKFNSGIKIDAPTLIKPGDVLPITIHSNDRQRVAIFAVDEGILQVSNYKLVNPLNYFIRKRALSVRTSQILDLILPKFNQLNTASAPGGDSDEYQSGDMLSAHLNPFKRKVDAPVAYWSGIVEVDGSKTVEYTVPDYFNGKIRIMAVSTGQMTMGAAQSSTTVRNDFVLTPNIPYFVAPGDTFDVSLGVANNLEMDSDQAIPITVTLTTTPHISIVGEATKQIDLAKSREGVVKFTLKATEQLGSGDMHFKASYAEHTTDRSVSTSVRPASQYRLQTVMGRMPSDSHTIDEFREMYKPYSQREALVSLSPLALSKGLSAYLDSYPHQCSEQLISKAIPSIIDNKHPELGLIKQSDKANVTALLNHLYQVLQIRQNTDGAIGTWYSTYSNDPFITLYTVHFLLEARDAGQVIPQKILNQANSYLRVIAENNRRDLNGLRLRAYAIYLLTRQNQITTSYLASIQTALNNIKDKASWNTDVTALYLASSYSMLKMDREAEKLLKPVWQQMQQAYDNAWWSHNYFDPLVINASNIYLISKHFPQKIADIPAQALENMVIMLNKGRYTTYSSATVILALDSYATQLKAEALSPETLTVSILEGKTSQEDKLKVIGQLQGLIAQGQFTENTTQIRFDNQTKLPAWYLVSEQGFDQGIQDKPITRGFEIIRQYTNAAGELIDHVSLGETINVNIKVRSLSQEALTNLAIVDLLPGGFDVVQQDISSRTNYMSNIVDNDTEYDGEDYEPGQRWVSPVQVKGSTWSPDYVDVREDRIIIYGAAHNGAVQQFSYQIKATNVGDYIVPSAFGEAMYDRDISAVSVGGQRIVVEPKK